MKDRFARISLAVGLLVGVYACSWLLVGCAPVRSSDPSMPRGQEPNLNAVLSIIGRFGMCHACPIAPDLALTAAHCVDLRPFDAQVPAFGGRYSNADSTVSGVTNPLAIAAREDLAVLELVPPTGGYYPVAVEEPQEGHQVWWLGYDYHRKSALRPKRSSGALINVLAGNIITGEKVDEGASGGCVLNGAGEVVGLINWRLGLAPDEMIVIGVGVWGKWTEEVVQKARDRQAERKKAEQVQEHNSWAEWIRWLEEVQ